MQSKSKSKFYYGYIITLLCAMCYFGSNGILNVSAGNIINELINQNGWSATQTSLAFTVRSLMGFSLPLVALAVAKFGPRHVIGITTMFTAVCLVLTAYTKTPLQFIIVYGIGVSLTMLFNDQLAIFAMVNNWWTAKRGHHNGIVNAAGALGGVVFPVLVAILLKNYGWKTSLYVLAILLVVITGLPQLIFYRNHPEEVGQVMDGGQTAELVKESEKHATANYISPVDWETKDAIRTPQVWLIMLSWGLMVLSYIAIMYFSITKFVVAGVDSVKAAQVVSAANLFTMLGSLFFSRYIDKIGGKRTLVIAAIGSALGCFIIAFAGGSLLLGWVASIIYGLTNGLLSPSVMSLLPSYYGVKNYVKIQGSTQWVLTLFSGFSATLLGVILDKTGYNFMIAFIVAGAASAIALIMALALKPPKLTPKYEAILAEKNAAAK